ncbi:YihY/virulence factor BrkB family protein [Cellulomonas sp. DKR-3]|uniref:YihY/virulence factor BrkB family protein n=1 Tax=Cellulomonas fulva TaxID=2835530 RepID=A0ABS5TVW8_9CELL|nr:YhjD/YihY/BrkB family envelope integrity protein [Cellulomonas fulva]MBT0993293.1 YihY/virulence factor BrkB family protein [Cellulomonas fulva]
MAGGTARRVEAARGWGERRWESTRRTATGRLLERVVRDLVGIELFDRAMTLAAQAFTSIVPLLLVAAALRPGEDGFGQTVSDSLGLPDETRAALAGAVPDDSTVLSTVGVLGLLVTLVSATSFSRALERIYLRVWQVRRPGLRTAWRWLATVVAVALAALLIGFTRRVVDPQWLGLVQLVLQLVVWTVVWTFVPWVLLRGQVAVRPLAWTALLTGVGLAVLGRVGALYLPVVLSSGARQFGVLGLVFAYLGWLFALSFVVVAAAAIGHACATDDGPVGRWVRGRDSWQEVQG